MTGKKYIIVNSSTSLEGRVDLLYEYLTAQGNEVTVLASNYIHREKKKRTAAKHPYVLIHTKPYRKNISIARLCSHNQFSKDAFQRIRDMEADVLYLVVPQNSNAKIAKWYRKCYPDTKIIIDIVDMWPESFPIHGTEHFPFTLWGKVRDSNLHYADLIVTECDYYQERLKKQLQGKNVVTMPWLKPDRPWHSRFEDTAYQLPNDKISLCYLGSVNNIIDIDKICRIIREIRKKKPVALHIIGNGERISELKAKAKEAGAEVEDHGAVYDEAQKQQIMDQCHFGLNIMKDTVCVGLSMKSVDYLAAGLPIINNLPGDIAGFIERYRAGINLGSGYDLTKELSAVEDFDQFNRQEIRKQFEKQYSARRIKIYIDQMGLV